MFSILFGAGLFSAVLACPQHDISAIDGIARRADATADWSYGASRDWHTVNTNYTVCQTGTQQSPIQLMISGGLSKVHVPVFKYSDPVKGNYANWGYGPSFTPTNTDITVNPSMTFDNETVYLKGWHVHVPAEHLVDGVRAMAELHLVHADSTGLERAVVGIRIDTSDTASQFISQLPSMPKYNNRAATEIELNVQQALEEVGMVQDFWTYEGSLTSPPCREGLRWFVAADVLKTDMAQMRALLGTSMWSARETQRVWMQNVNV